MGTGISYPLSADVYYSFPADRMESKSSALISLIADVHFTNGSSDTEARKRTLSRSDMAGDHNRSDMPIGAADSAYIELCE